MAKNLNLLAQAQDEHQAIASSNAVHLSLQGKGGVGKSLVASILAQYLRDQNVEVTCIDTDPVNQTFSQYRALATQHLDLMRDGKLDQRGFDVLMERLLTEAGLFVIDSGASTFIPLWSYIVENQVLEILRQSGRTLYVHTVVTGGQALADTVKGFRSLADSTTQKNIIVWINEYFGKVEREGKPFWEMAAYLDNQERVFGSVHLSRRNPDTFGRDVEDVISRKLTFEEAIREGSFSLMTKQRLRVVQRDLFDQLKRIGDSNGRSGN